MTMIRLASVPVHVRTNLLDGRPTAVDLGSERLPVVSVARIRHEDSAYPAATGPRTLFEVETPKVRLALSFAHRTRRWTLEGLDRAA
jgi:hypothetical protein